MFKVDLLKGQGIPLKTRPTDIAIIAAGIAVPFIIAMVLTGIYLNTRVIIPVKQRELEVYEQKMKTFSEAVRIQQMFYRDRDSINASVPETASAVRKFIAWSPIIQAVAENMPGAMVLSRLEGKQAASQSPGVGAGPVPREVELSVSGRSLIRWDEEVKGFRNRLLESSTLKTRLQDVTVAQQSSKSGEKESVSYDLKMMLKADL